MNRQSVYFLQALWDADIDREKIAELGRENARYEIERSLKGALHPDTLWISDEAKKLRQRLDSIKKELEAVEKPCELLGLSEEYLRIIGEIQAMQAKTVRTLYAPHGPLVPDLHILARQLAVPALHRIREQVKYEQYRLFVLTGSSDFERSVMPGGDDLREWVRYYADVIYTLINRFPVSALDCRWAYEKRKVTVYGRLSFMQFVSVKPGEEEGMAAPGRAKVKTGREGNLRICGRGYITNLAPEDMPGAAEGNLIRRIPPAEDFSKIGGEDENPAAVLERYFGERKFMVSAEDYFCFLNMALIAGEFYFRMKRGNCMDCGLPLYQGVCPVCGK